MLNAMRHITEDLGKNVLLVTGGEPFEVWAWKIAEMYAPDDLNSRIRKGIALGISDREDTMETLEWLLKVKERQMMNEKKEKAAMSYGILCTGHWSWKGLIRRLPKHS